MITGDEASRRTEDIDGETPVPAQFVKYIFPWVPKAVHQYLQMSRELRGF